MPSLLESFLILFESDAEDVKKGAADAGDATDRLEEKLRGADKTAEQLGKSFLGLTRSAKATITALVSAGVTAFTAVNTAQQTDALGKFSRALGLNASEVNLWEQAVIRSGGTAESFRGSLGSLTRQLTDFALTGGGEAAEVLARLGISAFDAAGDIRSAFDVLPELASAFERLTEAEAFGFGQKLGLDQATILLLKSGRTELARTLTDLEKLGLVTEAQTKTAAAFNDAWADLVQAFTTAKNDLNAFLLPVFAQVIDVVKNLVFFIRTNGDLITGFFIGLSGVLTAVFLPAMVRVAATTLLAAAPFLLIGGAILAAAAAIAVLYEDVKAYTEGNASLIGQLEKEYPAAFGAAKSAAQGFIDLAKSPVVFALEFADDPEAAITALGESLLRTLKKVRDGVAFVRDAFRGFVADFLGEPDAIRQSIQTWFDTLKTDVTAFFGALGAEIASMIARIVDAVAEALPDFEALGRGVRQFFGIDDTDVEVSPSPAAPEAPRNAPGDGEPATGAAVRAEVDVGSATQERLADQGSPQTPSRPAVLPIGQEITRGALAENFNVGTQAVAEAQSHPLASVTNTTVATRNDNRNRTTHVSVGAVSIDAKGADATELAKQVGNRLQEEIETAIANFDDGVVA